MYVPRPGAVAASRSISRCSGVSGKRVRLPAGTLATPPPCSPPVPLLGRPRRSAARVGCLKSTGTVTSIPALRALATI